MKYTEREREICHICMQIYLANLIIYIEIVVVVCKNSVRCFILGI